MQEFTAPVATSYKIQCWGASGGLPPKDGHAEGFALDSGKGGYTLGTISLPNNTRLYLYIGESADYNIRYQSSTGYGFTFNGGGFGESPGGGATDVRLINSEWNNFESLKSRIMVAAGGGGGFYSVNTTNREPGHAGGLSGTNANCIYSGSSQTGSPSSGYSGEGGSQTMGGKHGTGASINVNIEYGDGGFGFGGFGYFQSDIFASSGGGGGYYGGGHGVHPGNGWTGGGGGSSFISGYTGCDAISSESTGDNIIHTGQPNHYSGKVFTNPVMIDGASIMPSPSGGTETGHSGNGYCIITWRQLPQ